MLKEKVQRHAKPANHSQVSSYILAQSCTDIHYSRPTPSPPHSKRKERKRERRRRRKKERRKKIVLWSICFEDGLEWIGFYGLKRDAADELLHYNVMGKMVMMTMRPLT